MSNLHYLEIGELAAMIASGEVSPVEATLAQLDRIAQLDGQLGSYATVTPELALAAAHEAERAIVSGRRIGPLHGIPIGIKDLFWTKDVPTAAGTSIHRGFVPCRDATVVERLRAAGAIILGKLQMTEGAYSDHHPSVRPPLNPWNERYWTGISSSGPGVALAAGLCHGAIASDTGGSIRWPCAANALTGLKPSWGRVSRDGTFELAASLDHVGPMARSASDIALLFNAILGPDPRDPTALQAPLPRWDTTSPTLEGVRIGFDPQWSERDVDEPVRAVLAEALTTFRGLGANLVEINVPDVSDAVADWPDQCAVEAAVAHAATYPSRKNEYGPVLASVLDRGMALSGITSQRILLRRMALRGAFDALFATVDLLLCPVQPFAPLTLATLGTMGEQPGMIARLQRYTCPFDMTGDPTITLPGGADDNGMPIGFQLAGGRLREGTIFRAAIAYQRATSWHRKHPEIEEPLTAVEAGRHGSRAADNSASIARQRSSSLP